MCGMGVGDLHADVAGCALEAELEVPSRYAAVQDGVRGEFGDDEGDGLGGGSAVGVTPLVQLVHRQPACQPRTTPGGGETLRERTYGDCLMGA